MIIRLRKTTTPTPPEEPPYDGLGIADIATESGGMSGTPGSDVLAFQHQVPVTSETRIDGLAGDDTLLLGSGIGDGGTGDDTITVFEDDDGSAATVLGGAGDDVIITGDLAIVDAGEGDDTVIQRVFSGEAIDVTLGEGNDTIAYLNSLPPTGPFATVADFDPAEDRIEILRTPAFNEDMPPPISAFDVTAQSDGNGGSVVTILAMLQDDTADPEEYSLILEGFDPADVGSLIVSVTDTVEEDPTEITPTVSGTDLIYDIDTENFTLGADVSDAEDNDLSQIERVIFNVDPAIEARFYVQEYSTSSSSDDAGTEFRSTRYASLVQGPLDTEGAPISRWDGATMWRKRNSGKIRMTWIRRSHVRFT